MVLVRLVLADSVRLSASASAWWLEQSSHRSSSRDYGVHCQHGGPTRWVTQTNTSSSLHQDDNTMDKFGSSTFGKASLGCIRTCRSGLEWNWTKFHFIPFHSNTRGLSWMHASKQGLKWIAHLIGHIQEYSFQQPLYLQLCNSTHNTVASTKDVASSRG